VLARQTSGDNPDIAKLHSGAAMDNAELPIYLRTAEADAAQDFEGDLFNRKNLADRLTKMLDRLPEGAVIAIDAPWGEGKSWFGARWRASIRDSHRTAFVNCFQRDYLEDPFSMLAGTVLELAKEHGSTAREKLADAGRKLGAALLPSVTKAIVNAAGHWALGNAQLGDDMAEAIGKADESAAERLERLVQKRFDDSEAERRSAEAFKEALAKLASESEKRVVIFLDELDRCRPDFAVRTLERAKHFFDVPRVVFVLLINRRQLTAAVKGMYGAEVDADSYLAKFVQLWLALPKRASTSTNPVDDNFRYCLKTLERYGFPRNTPSENFASALAPLASYFGMSLRDVELSVALYSLAQPTNIMTDAIAWPIVLKLRRPELFVRCLAMDRSAHREAYQLAAKALEAIGGESPQLLGALAELHNLASKDFKGELPSPYREFVHRGLNAQPKQLFALTFGRVDLPIER
jgi:hypothetical protein